MKIRITVLLLLLASVAHAQTKSDVVPDYKPITGTQRFNWFVVSTVGPTSLLLAGPLSAAWGTALNSPREYGPGWEGFGKRYGMRLTGVSTGNAIEAGLERFGGRSAIFSFPRPALQSAR